MAKHRHARWNLSEYFLHFVILISGLGSIWAKQATCASRRCTIYLGEGETQDITFPGSVESVIGSFDEVRWTITASDIGNRILFLINDINWPKTDLKFEDLNPNQISIRHESKVFPEFPEYSTKLLKTGIFLSGTHSMRMEVHMPIVAELPSIPSFRMQFTAYTVTEIFRCKLNSASCEIEAASQWRTKSNGYIYSGSSSSDEGPLTIRLPPGTQLEGRGYASFGYVFEFKGSSGMSNTQSMDEEGRVTVECPGKQNFGISPDGAAQLIVDCDIEGASITFTPHGRLRLVITDVDLHDASTSMAIVDPGPSADSTSVLPVMAGVVVCVGTAILLLIAIAVFRRKRSQSGQEGKTKEALETGRANNRLRSVGVRKFEEQDDGTYHYPTFPLGLPPKDGDTVYQEIEKKDAKGLTALSRTKDSSSRETVKNAYDLLEVPADSNLDSNKKSRSAERLSIQGSPLLSRCRNWSMGYETLEGTTASSSKSSPSRLRKAEKGASDSESKESRQKPGATDYIEILSAEEIEALESQDKNGKTVKKGDTTKNGQPLKKGQPVLAHQDLYQRLQRNDNPFNHSKHGPDASKKSSSDGPEENYGKLDVATGNPPGGPTYFVLEANTDC